MKTKTKNGKSTQEIYQAVTDRIIASLETEVIPWHRPWKVLGGHKNLTSKKSYRGINQWLLELTAIEKGYASPWWLTYKQAKGMGGQVRKGEKSTMVVFWKPLSIEDKDRLDNDGQPKRKTIWMIRHYNVFNAEQCDGIELPAEPDFEPIEAAEKVYPGMPNRPPLKHGGDRAFYVPSQDRVQLPYREQADSPEDYYSTQFHELAHSTGHESRLGRPEIMDDSYEDESYSKEELVAEMTAAMLCGFLGLDIVPRHENSVAYISHWMSKLGEDPKLISQAASKAQRAADFILDNGGEKNEG